MLSLAILAAAFLTAGVFRAGAVVNAEYLLCGLLFAVNSAWPAVRDWRDHRRLRRGVCLGGLAVIIIFGFCLRCNP